MSPFETKLSGTLYGLLRWSDWDALRQRLLADTTQQWFAYAVGAEIALKPLSPAALGPLLTEIDGMVRSARACLAVGLRRIATGLSAKVMFIATSSGCVTGWSPRPRHPYRHLGRPDPGCSAQCSFGMYVDSGTA